MESPQTGLATRRRVVPADLLRQIRCDAREAAHNVNGCRPRRMDRPCHGQVRSSAGRRSQRRPKDHVMVAVRSALASADRATLLDAVSDPDPKVRYWACRHLDHHELDRTVATRMLAALSDPNKKVRAAALHTLSCEACKPDDTSSWRVDVVAVTLAALGSDPSLRVRRSAAAALMWRWPLERRVRRAFHRVLRDETDPELRSKAERALAGDAATRGEREG
jgi:hypothetical protein